MFDNTCPRYRIHICQHMYARFIEPYCFFSYYDVSLTPLDANKDMYLVILFWYSILTILYLDILHTNETCILYTILCTEIYLGFVEYYPDDSPLSSGTTKVVQWMVPKTFDRLQHCFILLSYLIIIALLNWLLQLIVRLALITAVHWLSCWYWIFNQQPHWLSL